ncbi:MAG: glycoside hydrolase family 3 C-terminal domain-containing protein, partial [Oscillospiraceae bacterium]|nr:glycoside hydrolase family 3 C-terminal domain-containing protein [Oscillospiraceae bacterium]
EANPNREGEFYIKSVPTLKHYAANNSEGNRFTGSSNIDNKLMRDYYTWAFQKITERTNVASLMTAYNAVNGVPAAASDYLNNTLLRKIFGFTGYIVGDCGALTYLVERQNYVNTYPEAVALGLQGGTDQDCGGGSQNWIYDKWALAGIDQGFMTEDDMDRALIRTLALRFRSGEFDGGAYKSYTMTNTAESAANRNHALLAAQQAAILLENNGALPIALSGTGAASSINVYGPLARRTDLGDYSGRPTRDMQNFKTGFTNYINAKPAGSRPPLNFLDGMTPIIVESASAMMAVGWIGFGSDQIVQAATQRKAGGSNLFGPASNPANNQPKNGEDYNGLEFEQGSFRNLTQVSDGSWIRVKDINLGKMDELRVWAGTINRQVNQAVFHLDSPDGPTVGVVTIPPAWGINSNDSPTNPSHEWHMYPRDNNSLNATPPTYGAITAVNWYRAGFTTKAYTDAAVFPEGALGTVDMPRSGYSGTDIGDRNRIDYEDMAAGSYLDTALRDQEIVNGAVRDIYVEFIYRRDSKIDEAGITAAETGKTADSVSVLYVGTSSGFNGNYNSAPATGYNREENDSRNWGAFKVCGEHADRKDIRLPANQEELIDKVVAATKAHNGKVVVVMQTVGCIDVSAFKDKVDAILWTPYNGQRQAEALSSLLTGDYNPGGHTTQTWYKEDQLTSNTTGFFENYDLLPAKTDGKGRTYMYLTGQPLYPFGYGLSYTDFTVSNVAVNKTSVTGNDKITVTADVKNTGSRDGAEVVQVYVKTPGAGTGAVPKKQLCGFARVEVPAGQTKTAIIEIPVSDFSAIDEATVGDFEVDRGKIDPQNVDFNTVTGGGHGKRVVKTGNYTLEVGNSSANVAGSCTVNVAGGLIQKIKLVTLEYSKLTMMIGQKVENPGLFVCMADETFLTSGYTVVYSSSSPAVTVDPATGAITAANGGTALITAAVTYNGQTVKATAPVAVANYPYVTGITVDGKPLENFAINRDRYEYLVPFSQSAMPVIEYVNPDPDNIADTLIMPSKINGRATLTVAKAGEKTVTYIIDMAYPSDPNNNPVVGTIRKNSSMVSRLNGNTELYIDWTEASSSEDGKSMIDLTAANPDNLYLTFTLTIDSDKKEQYPAMLQNLGSSSNISIRSTDTGGQEGRFGWYINRGWNLQYGENYIRIPLKQAMTRTDLNPTGERDNYADDYRINVNGEDIVFTEANPVRERTRGVINWRQINRVLCNIQTTGVPSADIGTFSAVITDFKFVDESGKAAVPAKRAELLGALAAAATEKRGSYTKATWAAYTAILKDAAGAAGFADEVEPFNYYLNLIANRDSSVLRQLGFVSESAGKNKVDINDARLILQYLVDKVTLTPAQLDAAAVNGDENQDNTPKVTITDARLVLQYIVDKINKFPAAD